MAYDLTKLASLLHIKNLINKIKEVFATKDEMNEVGQAFTTLQLNVTSVNNQMNNRVGVLESGLNNLQSDLTEATSELQTTKNKVTSLEQGLTGMSSSLTSMGSQITSMEQSIDAKIAVTVSSAYKAKGSKTFAQLPTVAQMSVSGAGGAPVMLGYVYNMTESFTTDDRFVEGAGKTYPAGTNIVVVTDGGSFKFDVLAGLVDLSGYVEKDGNKVLSTHDYTTAEKTKLAGIGTMTAATASAAGKTGLVPAPAAGTQTKYLRGDGTWAVPTNTTYSVATTSANGLLSKEDKTKLNGINIATDAEVEEMFDELFAS